MLSKVQIPIWLAYTVIYSDWAEFNIPSPFGLRVRNALNAEPTSVRLSNLVGAGGLWYGFGKTIMEMYVSTTTGYSLLTPSSLSDEQADEMSDVLVKAFRGRILEVIDQAQHFAALGQASGGGGGSSNSAQSFREGLDTTERERESSSFLNILLSSSAVFALAQESAKRTKQWAERR